MISVYKYENIQELAHAVAESAALMDHKLTTRPYNQYDPAQTDWWLIPSTEWPAYHHGKALLNTQWRDWSPAEVFSCLHVEKGFGPKAAQLEPALRRRHQVLEDDWLWRSFLRDLSEGHIVETARGIALDSNEPVQFEITAIQVNDPGRFDPYTAEQDDRVERVRFRIAGEGEHLIDGSQARDFLGPAARVSSLSEIPAAFRQVDPDWVWINIRVGVELIANDDPEQETWSAADIWRRTLRPWLPWIR